MHRQQGRYPQSIHEIATEAMAARRSLIAATRENLAVLPMADRVELNNFLSELARHGCFDPEPLGAADDVIARLQAAIERVGGAPVKRWTEEGHGYHVGGTETGHRIEKILDALRLFRRHAVAVADRLEAEHQLARHRDPAAVGGAPSEPI
jgi:hypothetical protein